LLLDHILSHEPEARCAFECFATKDNMIIGGEMRVKDRSIIDHKILEQKIREHLKYIGHNDDGFNWKNVPIKFIFHDQSQDIAIGVDSASNKDEGAGDQGIMFGYACSETENFMPSAIYYSHKILENIWNISKNPSKYSHLYNDELLKIISNLGPDAKSQVSVKYSDDGNIISVDSVTISIQHKQDVSISQIKNALIPLIQNSISPYKIPQNDRIFINPTGKFVIGGPVSDTGLTGRKIIVDSYGGYAPHGGGAFSGKDPTKVDRSAAYIARYLAKNIVASGLGTKCLIQLSYVIGISYPISIFIDFLGTKQSPHTNEQIVDCIRKLVDLSPRGIRTYLKLNNPIYLKTSTFGHFGREPDDKGHFSWERLDLVEKIKQNLI
jgi:S-adenosylmethionine synthetase